MKIKLFCYKNNHFRKLLLIVSYYETAPVAKSGREPDQAHQQKQKHPQSLPKCCRALEHDAGQYLQSKEQTKSNNQTISQEVDEKLVPVLSNSQSTMHLKPSSQSLLDQSSAFIVSKLVELDDLLQETFIRKESMSATNREYLDRYLSAFHEKVDQVKKKRRE